jgi:hypothetical protein
MTNVVLLKLVFFIPATCGPEKRAATSAGAAGWREQGAGARGGAGRPRPVGLAS